MMDFEALVRRADDAKAKRANWDSQWQDIAERVLPQMAQFNTRPAEGATRTEKMFDATAALAAQKAVSTISTFTWPDNQRYQRLTTDDPALNKVHRVKMYFDELTDAVFRRRYSHRAAFVSQMSEATLQYIVFGTSALFVDHDDRTGSNRYKSMHLSGLYLLENAAGLVDTVFRTWDWSLRNIAQTFGADAMPQKYREKLERYPDQTVCMWHAVCPRTDYEPGKLGAGGMPWASVYWIEGEKEPISVGGFRSWPFALLRYMTSPGEVYGRSPAWMALSNIKVLNAQKRSILQAAQKVVDPPLLAAEDGILGVFSQVPGAVNFGGLDAQGNQLVKPLITGADVRIGMDMMDKEREIISGAFFLDVFRALVENPQMTATQALELLQERATLMSPIVGRLESEALGPMTEREIGMMAENGDLPEMPPELIEAQGEYKIEYTSPARKAMRASEGIAITRTLEAVIPIAQARPEVLDVFDAEAIAREMAEINGVPAAILRSPEAVEAMKQGRAQQAEAAALLQAAPVVSDTAANLVKLQQAGGRPQL